MKVLLLPDDDYEYLQHVVRAHTLAGIEPEEGYAASKLWAIIGRAQDVTTSPAPTPDPRDAQSEQTTTEPEQPVDPEPDPQFSRVGPSGRS